MIRHRPSIAVPLLIVLLVAPLVAGCTPADAADGPPGSPLVAGESRRGEDTTRGREPVASPIQAGTATPTARPTPRPTPAPTPVPTATPRPPTETFALNLFERGDFVPQYTFEWCVGASIQMTLNMIGPSDDRSRARQQRHWELARDLSDSPFGGASPIGWTEALNRIGVGPYRLVSVPTLDGALATAAAALRATARPVGLVMWSGRHAWMMSGFTSLGDPATEPGFRVTGVHVLDPLYPHGSRAWGPSPQPNELLTPDQVGEQFVARLRGRVHLGVAPGYLLILPVAA
jgi:hypothetical protein